MKRQLVMLFVALQFITTFTSAAEHGGALGITLNSKDANGVWIVAVTPGTPAARARLQAGDQILAVDGKPVAGCAEVIRAIVAGKPGSKMRFEIDRQGLQGSIWAVVGTQAEIQHAVRAHDGKQKRAMQENSRQTDPVSKSAQRQIDVDDLKEALQKLNEELDPEGPNHRFYGRR